MRKLILLAFALITTWTSLLVVAADLVVITHPKTAIDTLTREEVINIYMGRYRQLPSGQSAEPLDHPATSPERAEFYRRLLGKELGEINAYWARLVFSGRTQPPRHTTGSAQTLQWVASMPGTLGYVERSRVDGRVRIVYELGQ